LYHNQIIVNPYFGFIQIFHNISFTLPIVEFGMQDGKKDDKLAFQKDYVIIIPSAFLLTGGFTMDTLKYLSPEWANEAQKRLREQLSPEVMKHLTSSMVTLYQNCPDGVEKALFYNIVDGVFQEISLKEGIVPEAEFVISGDYDTFARISKAELGSRSALMGGKLRLKGNMVKALSLASIVDRLNKVLSEIPCEY
jgi:putative sterol carrier protein